MEIINMEIAEKVLEKLKNDSVLATYVKEFTIGGGNISRKIFPYVAIVDVSEVERPLCIGNGAPNEQNYRITIQGGTYHTLSEIARRGNGSGKKGMVQLNDDIVTAVFPDNICGLFNPTVRLVKAEPKETPGSGGRSWTTSVIIMGSRTG